MEHPGFLVACEGIDGSGKSLLAKNIVTAMLKKKIPCILTKEPGGTELGKKLRELLNFQTIKTTSLAEYLLFAADRAQHFEESICPELNKGTLVISDRLADSSLAYQGYGRGLNLDLINQTNMWAMHHKKPDIVFYLKIDPLIAQQRLHIRNETTTSFEQEQLVFWRRVVHGFETIFANRKEVITLDATLSPYELTTSALEAITTLWNPTKL